MHIFRECSRALQIWNIMCPIFVHILGDILLIPWLDANIRDIRTINANGISQNTCLVSTFWNIWKAINDLEFNGKIFNHNQVVIKSFKYAEFIYEAFNRNLVNREDNRLNLIKRNSPNASTVKINTNGSTSNNFNYASFGGLARKAKGKQIEGFCGFIRATSPLKATMLGERMVRSPS